MFECLNINQRDSLWKYNTNAEQVLILLTWIKPKQVEMSTISCLHFDLIFVKLTKWLYEITLKMYPPIIYFQTHSAENHPCQCDGR